MNDTTSKWPRCPRCGTMAEVSYEADKWLVTCPKCIAAEYGDTMEQAARCFENPTEQAHAKR